jgi:hypothetical protein
MTHFTAAARPLWKCIVFIITMFISGTGASYKAYTLTEHTLMNDTDIMSALASVSVAGDGGGGDGGGGGGGASSQGGGDSAASSGSGSDSGDDGYGGYGGGDVTPGK